MKPIHALFALLISLAVFSSSCAPFVVGAAAGGAGAYILHDKGYRVQSPISK